MNLNYYLWSGLTDFSQVESISVLAQAPICFVSAAIFNFLTWRIFFIFFASSSNAIPIPPLIFFNSTSINIFPLMGV